MMASENATNPDSAIVCFDDNEIEPLTGKPFFHMTMKKSHLTQPRLPIPAKSSELLPENVKVPVVLTRGSKSWHMTYLSHRYSQRRLCSGWKAFVEDNMLKLGDVCLFEIMSCDVTLIKFKVQILRGDFPAALLDREGGTQDTPVAIQVE